MSVLSVSVTMAGGHHNIITFCEERKTSGEPASGSCGTTIRPSLITYDFRGASRFCDTSDSIVGKRKQLQLREVTQLLVFMHHLMAPGTGTGPCCLVALNGTAQWPHPTEDSIWPHPTEDLISGNGYENLFSTENGDQISIRIPARPRAAPAAVHFVFFLLAGLAGCVLSAG